MEPGQGRYFVISGEELVDEGQFRLFFLFSGIISSLIRYDNESCQHLSLFFAAGTRSHSSELRRPWNRIPSLSYSRLLPYVAAGDFR